MVTVSPRIALIRKAVSHLSGTLRQEMAFEPLVLAGNRGAQELISVERRSGAPGAPAGHGTDRTTMVSTNHRLVCARDISQMRQSNYFLG